MSDTTQQLVDMVTEFSADATKFWNGNSAAGTRARKTLQDVIKYCKEERKRIQEEKNSRKAAKAK